MNKLKERIQKFREKHIDFHKNKEKVEIASTRLDVWIAVNEADKSALENILNKQICPTTRHVARMLAVFVELSVPTIFYITFGIERGEYAFYERDVPNNGRNNYPLRVKGSMSFDDPKKVVALRVLEGKFDSRRLEFSPKVRK